METTYYTLTAREILVAGDAVEQAAGGGGRRLAFVRKGGCAPERAQKESNVIDLAAWKADRAEEARLEELWYGGVDQRLEGPAAEQAAPRARQDHRRTVLFGGELLATLSVIGVMALLMLRLLAG